MGELVSNHDWINWFRMMKSSNTIQYDPARELEWIPALEATKPEVTKDPGVMTECPRDSAIRALPTRPRGGQKGKQTVEPRLFTIASARRKSCSGNHGYSSLAQVHNRVPPGWKLVPQPSTLNPRPSTLNPRPQPYPEAPLSAHLSGTWLVAFLHTSSGRTYPARVYGTISGTNSHASWLL